MRVLVVYISIRSIRASFCSFAGFLFLNLASIFWVYAQDASIGLREKVEGIASGNVLIDDEKVAKPELVLSFYSSTDFNLGWHDKMDVAMMLALLQRATEEGLNPRDYHFTALTGYYYRSTLPDHDKVSFDILLTDAFMLYGSHLSTGKSNPTVLYPNEWIPSIENFNLVELLRAALEENGLAKTIDALRPSHPGYEKLKQALKVFKRIQQSGSWIFIEQGGSIEPGMVDDRVPSILKRLSLTGVLPTDLVSDSILYDSMLVPYIRKFQRQYGLADDGIIGKYTLECLNFSPEYHIQKINANLERYRWLPDDWGEEYLTINIPAFALEVFAADAVVMKMKAIVGRPDRKTPVFSSDIRYLILNPTWTIPPTILREDALPAIKRNIRYLERNNIRVFNKNGVEVDATLLPWSTYTARNFPYQLRQDPGPNNSLGLIKFQLINNFKVFLHDTNHRGLFSQANRALSSGCIRIEHPFLLAQYLLRETFWDQKKIEKAIESGRTTTIVFPKPAIVHLLYFTAFVDEENVLQLRNDMYEWDAPLINNLLGSAVY